MSVRSGLTTSDAQGGKEKKHISFTDEEKQAVLDAITDSSDDAIVSKTLDGIITSWNKAATKIFGFTEAEAIGKSISIIIPDYKADEEKFILESIRADKKIDHLETVRVSKSGTEIYISLSVSPIKNKEGKIIGASKVARDISYKKLAIEKQTMLAAIVESSADAIISKTLDGTITSWNNAARKMFGYTEEEAIGKNISIIIPDNRMDEEKLILESIRAGKKIDHFETIRIGKNGLSKQISLTVSPVKDFNGEIIGASKIARDISARIKAEKKQKLYTKKLQDLNKYKDEFMVMASHELKTPLTVIFANLQILQKKLDQEPLMPFLNTSVKQVQKLTNLVSNLLDVSKIQAGKMALNKTDFNISALLKEVAKDLQRISPHHLLKIKLPAESNWIHADKERIEQVLVNLISNAIKYMPAGGEIWLSALKKTNLVEVSVSDTGIGIPRSDHQNIFERFYRVSGHSTTFTGSGVGLYISAEIIKAHNGTIWVRSEPGKGSVFYFSLPCNIKST